MTSKVSYGPIDLGLDLQVEGKLSYLERDAPPISLTKCIDKPIFEQAQRAKEAGKFLSDNRLISLLFLLLSNNKRALQLCREIESKKLPVPEGMSNGEAILQSLLSCASQNPAWELKIICALHLVKAYKAIVILQPRLGPGGPTKTRQEYEGKERFFIDPIRISLFDIAKDLKRDDAKSIMSQMGHAEEFNRMETGFLQALQRKSQESLLKVIMRHHECSNPDSDVFANNKPANAVELKRGKLLILALENYNEANGYAKREGTQPDIDAVVNVSTLLNIICILPM